MNINLTYFKPASGKYYSSGNLNSDEDFPTSEEIAFIIRRRQQNHCLPGLINGHSDYDVLIEAEDRAPQLLKAGT